MNTEDKALLKRYIDRERLARKEAESFLEAKSLELYKANQGLQELATSLESKVLERTHELQDARDEALRANEAKSMFLANVSHELRTPLNAVIGLTELMEDLPMENQIQEYHGLIQSSAKMLLERINELLDLSKIEAGRLELHNESFRLSSLVEEAVGVLGQSAFSKGIDIVSYIAPDIPDLLMGDPLHLRQVFTNLLNNAIKFTEQGGIALVFTGASQSEQNVLIEFMVEDSGIGMAPDALEKVFLPFQQADLGTSRRFGGTGLGLTLCSRLIEEMGGTLTVESTPGKGTVFHGNFCCGVNEKQGVAPNPSLRLNETAVVLSSTPLTGRWIEQMVADCGYDVENVTIEDPRAARLVAGDAPLIVADCCARKSVQLNMTDPRPGQKMVITRSGLHCAQCPFTRGNEINVITKPITVRKLKRVLGLLKEPPVPSAPVRTPSIPDLDSLKILVADDNRVNQLIIEKQLEKLGNPPTLVVACGASALAAAKEQPFDLILMDCEMPEMDGLEATRCIRGCDNPNRETVIVALTAHAMVDFRDQCHAAGMNYFLSKPVKLREIKDLLEQVGGQHAFVSS